jgi:hypothetical protein
MVVAIEELVAAEARRFGQTSGDKEGKAEWVPALLLHRSIQGGRYAALTRAVQGAKQGRQVTQSEAMSALLVALELFW